MTNSNAPLSNSSGTTRITIEKDYLHFSCAHFTIFSATERENLHGHNYHLKCELDLEVGENGLCFDYNTIKTALMDLCNKIDEYTLLPTQSPFLKIQTDCDLGEAYLLAHFDKEQIPFLTRDVQCLPLSNITIEELSRWLLEELNKVLDFASLPIQQLSLGVSSGAGQWAIRQWHANVD